MESKRLDNAALAAGISPATSMRTASRSLLRGHQTRLLDAMHRKTAAKVAVNPLPNVKVFTHGKKCAAGGRAGSLVDPHHRRGHSIKATPRRKTLRCRPNCRRAITR
jgi:hypothetical protein